jgi:excisionase family DNA binding protein
VAANSQPSQRIARVSRNFAANLLPDFPGGTGELFTVRQVAELVGVCAATVYKWAADGVLPHVRIVNVTRIRRKDLDRLISAHGLTLPAPPGRSL